MGDVRLGSLKTRSLAFGDPQSAIEKVFSQKVLEFLSTLINRIVACPQRGVDNPWTTRGQVVGQEKGEVALAHHFKTEVVPY